MGQNLCNWTLGMLDSVSTNVTTCAYVLAACQVLKQDGGLEMPLQFYLYNIIVLMCKTVLGMFQVFTQGDCLEIMQQ